VDARNAAPGDRRGVATKLWVALAFACLGLLGQGERLQVDARFSSPKATLLTYWEAVRSNDAETVIECFADPGQAVPLPGMLWFMPATDTLRLNAVRLETEVDGSTQATYEVCLRPAGEAEDLRFLTTNALVRIQGEWHLVLNGGEVPLPELRPSPRPVDI
jgi:hypothetical protein